MIHKKIEAIQAKIKQMDTLVENMRASFSYSTPGEMLINAKKVYDIECEIKALLFGAIDDLDNKGISSFPAFKHFKESH